MSQGIQNKNLHTIQFDDRRLLSSPLTDNAIPGRVMCILQVDLGSSVLQVDLGTSVLQVDLEFSVQCPIGVDKRHNTIRPMCEHPVENKTGLTRFVGLVRTKTYRATQRFRAQVHHMRFGHRWSLCGATHCGVHNCGDAWVAEVG